MLVLYPLSEIDTYNVDTFCTAETFGCVYSIYTADILANDAIWAQDHLISVLS